MVHLLLAAPHPFSVLPVMAVSGAFARLTLTEHSETLKLSVKLQPVCIGSAIRHCLLDLKYGWMHFVSEQHPGIMCPLGFVGSGNI